MARKKVEINPECGKRVAEFFKTTGIKQNVAAERLFYSKQQLSRIVQGKCRLTEDLARKIVSLHKPQNPLDQFRYQYLLCQDDYRTENEHIDTQMQADFGSKEYIERAIEARGYKLMPKDFLCLYDGYEVVRDYGPNKTPEWAYTYEQEHGNKHIPKGVTLGQLMQRTGLHFAYQTKIAICAPNIGGKYYSPDEYDALLEEIGRFIDFKVFSWFINPHLTTKHMELML